MKIPLVYDLNGRRRCLLVQDGETIRIGRAEDCAIRIEADEVPEVAFTAQLVNDCQVAVVQPSDGRVPYAQPLPWKLVLGGVELVVSGPLRPDPAVAGQAKRTLRVQGVGPETIRHVLTPERPLLLGASPECDVVLTDAGCPAVVLACRAAGNHRLRVQVLDDSAVVSWLGRAGEMEADLELPVSLSLGSRMILLSSDEASGDSAEAKRSSPAEVLPSAVPVALIKPTPNSHIIVARQAPKLRSTEGMPAPRHRPPQPLPSPVALEASPASEGPVAATKVLTLFILASWLLLGLTAAAVFLPDVDPRVWTVAAGALILTELLGLLVLLG